MGEKLHFSTPPVIGSKTSNWPKKTDQEDVELHKAFILHIDVVNIDIGSRPGPIPDLDQDQRDQDIVQA